MSAVEELCAFGFEKYWVNQALELTNHDKECALEWLLSDEFKLAQEQYNAEQEASKKQHLVKKSFKKKQRQKEIEIEIEYEHNQQMEIEIEYDLNNDVPNSSHHHPSINISSNKSLEYTPNLLGPPSNKENNASNNTSNNTSAPFSKLSTTIVHNNDDSINNIDYDLEEEDDDMINMEYLDEMSMGNQSMDMSSINSSMDMSGSMNQYNFNETIDTEFIDNAPKLIYRELLHLKHTYITPLYYNHEYFIVSTKTFNNKNDSTPGIFLYEIKINQWKQIAKYPQMFNFQSHQHILDSDNNLLYIYNNNFEDGLFIIYDIKNNKFRGIKRNLYRGNRINNQPRMYQSICSIYIITNK